MDDILIDEKKYISSKQAAKITGYAKDYIGQLCREGRVPARLVGRSWYVLETAIQDHRFGDTGSNTEEKEAVKAPPKALPWTQQAPRYEVAPIEILPTAPRVVDQEEVAPEPQENIQNSWKAWFDRVGQTFQNEAPAVEEVPEASLQAQNEPESYVESPVEAPQEIYEGTEVSVPIHMRYKAPPREFLPSYTEEVTSGATEERVEEVRTERVHGRKRGYGLVKFIALVITVGAIVLATLGSGHLDRFIVSVSQVHRISGMSTYNK